MWSGDRVVQLDRRKGTVADEAGVWDKFGVAPRSIPDWLALVGDSADGFPGLGGWGRRSASAVLAHYGAWSGSPTTWPTGIPACARRCGGRAGWPTRWPAEREQAELFRVLATLRIDPTLLDGVSSLEWRGPTADFDAVCRHFGDPGLAERTVALAAR